MFLKIVKSDRSAAATSKNSDKEKSPLSLTLHINPTRLNLNLI